MNQKNDSAIDAIRNSHLEENRRFTQNALEMVLSMGDFQKEINSQVSSERLFREAETRIGKLIPFRTIAFYLVDQKSSDLVLSLCHPAKKKPYIKKQIEFLIDKGFIAWAIRERRGVTIYSKDQKRQLFLHVVSTYSRVRGMFIGVLPKITQSLPDASYELLSIILRSTANAIESIEYCQLLEEQRTKIKKAHDELDLKIQERTAELKEINKKLRTEILERKQAENEITILLKEIHHRVKNNMQVVASLMSLQADKSSDPNVINEFRETEIRVQSMAVVHEIIYRTENFSQILFQDYLENLVDHLLYVYTQRKIPAAIKIDAKNINLKIDHAVPCGLIVAELVTNSLKYAKPENAEIEIRISATYDNDTHFKMTIADNGCGLPMDVDPLKTKTLGLQLVTEIITDQMEGTFSVEQKQGVCWVIKWPI